MFWEAARKGGGGHQVNMGCCPAPGAPTCVPQLLVPIHGQDDQQVAQDVHHDGEDEDEGERVGHPRGSKPRALPAARRPLRGIEQRAAIALRGPARRAPRPGHRALGAQRHPVHRGLRLLTALPAPARHRRCSLTAALPAPPPPRSATLHLRRRPARGHLSVSHPRSLFRQRPRAGSLQRAACAPAGP